MLEEVTYKGIEKQLKFGQDIAGGFLKGSAAMGGWLSQGGETNLEKTEEIRAQGSALRELHGILKENDPRSKFGGLERVRINGGNFSGCTRSLWGSIKEGAIRRWFH